ncbi:hypothetical protein [Symmachiella dynata]|uniref:hypothetical protein n=1 Tax=Symmachiella dynata TaxID=2527995 RepID=UPI0018D38B2F|nr:hypothetical protein [Symmachiella dynata]
MIFVVFHEVLELFQSHTIGTPNGSNGDICNGTPRLIDNSAAQNPRFLGTTSLLNIDTRKDQQTAI